MAEQQMQEGGYERLGQKKLGLVDVVAQSVGFMGPVFSAAFIFPLIMGVISFTGKGAGIAAPLAVLIAAVGVFALGWIVAQYAKRIHAAGSLYDYVSNGLGSTIGTAAGWLYYGGTIVLTTGLGVLIGGYVHDTLMPAFGVEDGLLPIWLWDAIWATALFLVLYLGVRISTRVQLTLALVSVAVLLTYFVWVIIDLGGANDVGKAFDPAGSTTGGFGGVLFGVLYGVLIFVGFETAANLAEETAEPKRSIPKAVLGAVVAVSIFYLVASYAQVAGFGFALEAFATPDVFLGPVFALAGSQGFDTLLDVLILIVLLDMLAVSVGAAVASTRGVFALARDRRLPGALASVSSTRGTPVGAIALLMVVQALFILGSEFWEDLFALPETPHYGAIFTWASTFGGFALVVIYLLMSVGALVGLRDHPRFPGVVIASAVGIAITGGAIYGSFAEVPSPIVLAPYYALGLFVIGLISSVVFRGREPAAKALPDLRTHQE